MIHDERVTVGNQRRWLDEAQHTAAPDLAELEKLLERIASYAPKFAPPQEPSADELDELHDALLEAWRNGKDGRSIIDKFQHPWLTPERRQQFTAAQFTRAQITLHDELNAAKQPSDAQIDYLNESLQEAIAELLKRPDANAREVFAATYTGLYAAWVALFTKLIDHYGPLRPTPAHLIANSDEVRITDDITAGPQHRIGAPLAVLVIDHRARPWLPTPAQYAAEVERLTAEVTPTPPPTNGRVRSITV